MSLAPSAAASLAAGSYNTITRHGWKGWASGRGTSWRDWGGRVEYMRLA